jgi:Fic family protein
LRNIHAILTKHILQKQQQGAFRKGNMFVVTKDGKIEYVAANPDIVGAEMEKLFHDIDVLLNATLNFNEVIYFASMLHLAFVKIHPFEDGNGRTARLLEKWFVAQKLGEKSWYIQSEKYYYTNHQTYYHHLSQLGLEYDELNYSKANLFVRMLPKSITEK